LFKRNFFVVACAKAASEARSLEKERRVKADSRGDDDDDDDVGDTDSNDGGNDDDDGCDKVEV
jgi:hypothetical protein